MFLLIIWYSFNNSMIHAQKLLAVVQGILNLWTSKPRRTKIMLQKLLSLGFYDPGRLLVAIKQRQSRLQ